MTFEDFFTLFNGTFVDNDGAYGDQCVDLAQFYNRAIGNTKPFWGNAKDIYQQSGTYYVQVPNTPQGVPIKGDIVVWSGAFNGGPGHVAIATGIGDVKTFESFDQNFPTGYRCQKVTHSYSYVMGWLRMKNTPSTTNEWERKYNELAKQMRKVKDIANTSGV